LVPNFSAAAYDVTVTFLITDGVMLAEALFPDRDVCFFAAEADPELFPEGPLEAVPTELLFVEGAERLDVLPFATAIVVGDVDVDVVLVLVDAALLGVMVVTMLLDGVPAGSLDRGIALFTSICEVVHAVDTMRRRLIRLCKTARFAR